MVPAEIAQDVRVFDLVSAILQELGTMANSDIPLRDAPERFFDSALWNEYLSCWKTHEDALSGLSQPEPGIIAYYRQEIARQSRSQTPDFERDLRRVGVKWKRTLG